MNTELGSQPTVPLIVAQPRLEQQIGVAHEEGFALAERQALERALITALQDEPFEQGYSHPAEQILEGRLKLAPATTRQCLMLIMRAWARTRPRLAGDLVGCLGRMPTAQVELWGHSIAAKALADENVAVRDAAVRALEQWGDTAAVDILRSTRETVPWLRRYIDEVVEAHREP